MRQIIKYTLVVLGTISAVILIYQFRIVVLLLVISLALTATSRPLLNYLGRYRIPGFLAQLLILIIVSAAIFGFVILVGPVLTAEIQLLTNYSLVEYNLTYNIWETGPAWQQMIVSRLPEPDRLVDHLVGTDGELLLPTAVNLTQNLATFFSNLFIVLIFSLYLAQDHNQFIRLWLSLLPAHRRIPVRDAWQAMEQSIGQYLRHELALGLLAAMLLGTGYALLGLPYYAALAILAFIGWFIPLLGFAIILIPVFLAALGGGWWLVTMTLAFTLLILLGLKYWIEPKYLHPRYYSSFLIVFWIVVLGSLFGLGGYLAGPVVAVASQTLWIQYLQYRSRPELDEIRLADLRQRYTSIHERYDKARKANPSPQLGSLLDRLEHSLTQTEQLAEEGFTEN